jgi:hypothetical protein
MTIGVVMEARNVNLSKFKTPDPIVIYRRIKGFRYFLGPDKPSVPCEFQGTGPIEGTSHDISHTVSLSCTIVRAYNTGPNWRPVRVEISTDSLIRFVPIVSFVTILSSISTGIHVFQMIYRKYIYYTA